MTTSVEMDQMEYLAEMGFNCSVLTTEQKDTVLCALEQAGLEWDWATADDEGDEVRASRIIEAKDAVAAGNYESEGEMIASYVGALFDDFGIQR